MKENCEIIYKNIEKSEKYESTIKQIVDECFKTENLDKTNLYMSITLTEPDDIEKINMQYRNIDRPTDVLSFPMFEKEELEEFIKKNSQNTDITVQGDIFPLQVRGGRGRGCEREHLRRTADHLSDRHHAEGGRPDGGGRGRAPGPVHRRGDCPHNYR